VTHRGFSWALGPFIQQQMMAFVNEFNLMFTVLEALLPHILADCLLTRLKVWHYGVWLNRSPRESSFSLLPPLSQSFSSPFSPSSGLVLEYLLSESLSHTHTSVHMGRGSHQLEYPAFGGTLTVLSTLLTAFACLE